MHLFFRTRAEKRRANRRMAASFYAAMFALTLGYGAAMLGAFLFSWL